MKHLAKQEKPTEEGWYLWWDRAESKAPFHVLARVKTVGAVISVNFNWETDFNDWVPISEVADRLWVKVS